MKLRDIKKVKKSHIMYLREDFRKWLIGVGEMSQNPRMVRWAKELNEDALEFCLHLGFSEKCFVQLLSGVSVEESFGIEGLGKKSIRLLDGKG